MTSVAPARNRIWARLRHVSAARCLRCWGQAQDERDLLMRPTCGKPGHIRVGLRYAARIYRRLYHARYAGGSEWDFLTYFEFPPDRIDEFRALLATLRDPARNPEWAYVQRECELWLTRV